jgi:hypothetical protein
MTADDARRIETKVDGLIEAVGKLVLVEERQQVQSARMDKFDGRMDKLQANHETVDRKLERWINRGVGVWALAAALVAGLKLLH